MKKYSLLIIISTLLISCKNNLINSDVNKGKVETTIFFASDLHLYSKNLMSDNNKKYLKQYFTSDGRVQEFDYELLESLVKEVNDNKPDFLVLTGDLSFNGEKDSLIELKKKLDNINKETKTLVIPGNHDCYSINPFSCIDDNVEYLDGVSYSEFKEIFNDYGYSDACSYDETSLSYFYELNEDKWILMLDTSLSEYNYEYDMNFVGGALDETTFEWIEKNLKYAKENGIEVISSMHHNLLIHNNLFANNYTLRNANQLIDLYTKYNVRLNFSGHLHIQSIANEASKIYDISTGGLLDYGNRYGRLDIYDKYYDYTSNKLKFIDPNLNFEEYSFNNFYQEYYNKSIYSNEINFGEDGAKVTDFLSKVNAYYFNGDYEIIISMKHANVLLYNRIKNSIDNYENSYISTILDVQPINQHSLFIEK